MHLERLEILGFKTFAQKTNLEFGNPTTKKAYAVTAVIGPNGSGKSNTADAVRWVLGEQSMKLLRGKKSEDVIFSGSEGRTRSGFAEVSVILNNEDKKAPIDYAEIVITRRLYRDGESEYLMNGNAVRLADIHLLLAEANFGQRSYGVIAQGMIDHVLVAAPHERKEFFDDAAGVKSLQMKRHQAELKLERSEDNMKQAQTILAEITPRMKSLERQMNRLKQREEIEKQLALIQGDYYGGLWADLQKQELKVKERLNESDKELSNRKKLVDEANAKFATMEKHEEDTGGLVKMQSAYQELVREKTKLEHKKFELERTIAVQRIKLEKPFVPLPLSKIIAEVDAVTSAIGEMIEEISKASTLEEAKSAANKISALHERAKKLLSGLQRPPDDVKPTEDPKLAAELLSLATAVDEFAPKIRAAESALSEYSKEEQKKKGAFFELQRSVQMHQKALFELERANNDLRVELARVETRRETLNEEMHSMLDEITIASLKKSTNQETNKSITFEALRDEMFNLKRKLEFIGGIEPSVPQEFEETKARYEYLTSQVADLEAAIASTKKIMKELKDEIEKRSSEALKILNREFEKYFKKIFNGGTARIVEVKQEVSEEELAMLSPEEQEEIKKEKGLAGIDIQATPPGKRLKAINLLSGGERAMTSLALIAAIISMNPSPFVFLDEVDAALDEANSKRFSEILKELSDRTQFIVITHNRTTMEVADVLYGVTMGNDGISKLLSVKLEDVKVFARQ